MVVGTKAVCGVAFPLLPTWADAVQKQPLLPHEKQPLAKGTHLQADLGSVQGEGEEVSKTGCCASP